MTFIQFNDREWMVDLDTCEICKEKKVVLVFNADARVIACRRADAHRVGRACATCLRQLAGMLNKLAEGSR